MILAAVIDVVQFTEMVLNNKNNDYFTQTMVLTLRKWNLTSINWIL